MLHFFLESRLNNIKLLVLKNLDISQLNAGKYKSNELCKAVSSVPKGGLQEYPCDKSLDGRYAVVLQPESVSCLQLCELVVFGKSVGKQINLR